MMKFYLIEKILHKLAINGDDIYSNSLIENDVKSLHYSEMQIRMSSVVRSRRQDWFSHMIIISACYVADKHKTHNRLHTSGLYPTATIGNQISWMSLYFVRWYNLRECYITRSAANDKRNGERDNRTRTKSDERIAFELKSLPNVKSKDISVKKLSIINNPGIVFFGMHARIRNHACVHSNATIF